MSFYFAKCNLACYSPKFPSVRYFVLPLKLLLFQARPPGIYKDHYISDLADRYNAGDREEITTPTKPSWCFDEDGSGEEDEQAGDGSFRKRKKRRREVVKRDAKFVISTPLVTVAQSSIREEVQEACQVICNWERYVIEQCVVVLKLIICRLTT